MDFEVKRLFFTLLFNLDDFVGDLNKFYNVRFNSSHPLVESINEYKSTILLTINTLECNNYEIPSGYKELLSVSKYLVENLFIDNHINEDLYCEHINSFMEVLDLFNDSFDVSDIFYK